MWFSSKILYKSVHYFNGKIMRRSRSMFEEVILLVKARNEKQAMKKALIFARKGQHKYKNESGELVSWELIKLIEVQSIDGAIKDGIEVSSRFFTNLSAFKKVDSLI